MKMSNFFFVLYFFYIFYFNSRQVEFKEGENLIKDYDIELFMETSAKNGDNVEKLFCDAAKLIYEQYLEEQIKASVIYFFFLIFFRQLIKILLMI